MVRIRVRVVVRVVVRVMIRVMIRVRIEAVERGLGRAVLTLMFSRLASPGSAILYPSLQEGLQGGDLGSLY